LLFIGASDLFPPFPKAEEGALEDFRSASRLHLPRPLIKYSSMPFVLPSSQKKLLYLLYREPWLNKATVQYSAVGLGWRGGVIEPWRIQTPEAFFPSLLSACLGKMESWRMLGSVENPILIGVGNSTGSASPPPSYD
jgi:hypothetical protein